MARSQPRSNIHKLRAWAVLVSSILGLAIVSIDFYFHAENRYLLPFAFLLTAAIIPDKVGDVFASYAFDIERDEVRILFSDLPNYLVDSHHIVSFPTRELGLKYCIYLAESATRIRNTVLRYGNSYSVGSLYHADGIDKLYEKWLEARKDSVRRGNQVTEVISKYLAADDPSREQAIQLSTLSTRYRCHLIDDRANPLTQMTIFEFDEYKEVVLGWELPGSDEGRSFSSRNSRVVEHFEAYFEHTLKTQPNQDWTISSDRKSDRSHMALGSNTILGADRGLPDGRRADAGLFGAIRRLIRRKERNGGPPDRK